MTARRKQRPDAPRQARPSSGTSARGRGPVLAISAALILVTIAAYAPVWQFGFVALDDPQYVYANPDLAGGLSLKAVVWAFTTGHEANWHPLTWISHAVDISVFGMNAGGHHVMNLVIHLANTLLLFGLLRRMTGSTGRSAFVAAIFAVHPLHVESVAWVAERKDVLSALFFMLTIGAYLRYVDHPRRSRYAVVAICLGAGLLAKAMLVTTPMVLLLLDYWPLGRVTGSTGARGDRGRPASAQMSWTRLAIEKAPLLMIVMASSIVTFVAQRQGGAVKSLESFPLALRIENVTVSYLDYLGAALWPAGLGVFYPFPTALSWAHVAAAAAILAAITVAVVGLARRAPYLMVGWLWFVGMLVPVIGFVQIGGHARADRYMYLPIVGLAIAVAWGVVTWMRTERLRMIAAGAAAAVILASAVVTHAQVQYWRETALLWARTAEVTDHTNNFGVYFGLAEYLRSEGRTGEAIAAYEASIQRNPSYADARFGLVHAYVDARQPDRAIVELQEIARRDPASADARMSLGSLLEGLGRSAEAAPYFAEASRLKPDFAEGHWRLALALASTGRLVEALPEFDAAVRLDPQSAPMKSDYGWALAQHGQTALAVAQLNDALRLKPDLAAAHLNLGRVLAGQGRTSDALTHLAEAVRLEPDFLEARFSLAIAFISAGRIDEGAKELREVLARDPQNAAARRALSAIGR